MRIKKMHNKLKTVLNIDSTEARVEELYKILYNSYTRNGVSGIIVKVTQDKTLQNLEKYFECSIILHEDLVYSFESDSIRKVCTFSELKLASEMLIEELSKKYHSFNYMVMKDTDNYTIYQVFAHEDVDKDAVLKQISKENSETLIEFLKMLIQDLQDTDDLDYQSDQYGMHIAKVTGFFDLHNFSDSLQESVLNQVLQDFESTDGKVFINTIEQHKLVIQAKKDATARQHKNIITLWKMFLLLVVPAILIYHFI